MALMGLTYGPLGTFLSELFPTTVRYSGALLTFNMAEILGAAFAPIIAIWLASTYGLTYFRFLSNNSGLYFFIFIIGN